MKQMRTPFRKPNPDDLRNKAIYFLSRREYARKELLQKLQQKGFSTSQINPILDELENENLLSDERYIGSFIRIRRFKGYGPLKICAELGKRGIDHNRVRANEEWQESLWQESAKVTRMKRFGEAIPKEKQMRLQQARFLQQRGFTSDQIRAALMPI
jgi:regulatory protein